MQLRNFITPALRGLGIVFILLAFWYITFGLLIPLLAPTIPPQKFFIHGGIFLLLGFGLLRGALIQEFLHPSRYDVCLALSALLLWSYTFSWYFIPSFWSHVLNFPLFGHLGTSRTRDLIGIGYLAAFVFSSSLCISHIGILFVRPLRIRFRPLLLSHTAFLFSLLLSIGIGRVITTKPFPYLSRSFHS